MEKQQTCNRKLLFSITLIIFAIIAVNIFIGNKKNILKENPVSNELPSLGIQPTMGSNDAPISIVEFGDFKCPACKAWGEEIFPQLQKDYVDTGKVKFIHINVLFHGEESRLAALAAEAVFKQDPQSYWTFHKEVYNLQPENHDDSSSAITVDKLLEVAKKTVPNINLNKLQDDLNKQNEQAEINRDEKIVEKSGVDETPSIFINGTKMSNPYDYEQFKYLIEKELKGKK